MDSDLNRFDTEYSHARHCLDARMALGTKLSFIASQPGRKSKCEMVWIDHRETVTISVAASECGELQLFQS